MTAGGIVLCGGHSRRMGTPKAWLPVGGETFLGRTVRVVGEVCSPVVVVAAVGQELPPLPAGVAVVRDTVPDAGPLVGLLAGLDVLADRCEVVFVAACDLPGLTPELVAAVVAGLGDSAACVPVAEGRDHPLAAAYRLSVSDTAVSLLAAGERRMLALLAAVPTARLPADAWAAALRNVNTPAEHAVIRYTGGQTTQRSPVSPQELHEVVRERPFQPFRLVLSDGGFHDVHHPDMMIVGIRTSYLGLPSVRNPELAERSIRLDNLHITRVVPLPVNQGVAADGEG